MLMQHREKHRVHHIKKLASIARAIITNQIGLPLGMLRMGTTLTQIHSIRPITEIDLEIISEFNSKASGLPIGMERLSYNRDFLKKQDVILDELCSKYKDPVIHKCFEIIDKFYDSDKLKS